VGANFVKFIPSELIFLICNLRFSPHTDTVPRPVLHGVKRPGSEADRSRPSRDEVKNKWSYTFTPGDEIKDSDMGGACGTYETN